MGLLSLNVPYATLVSLFGGRGVFDLLAEAFHRYLEIEYQAGGGLRVKVSVGGQGKTVGWLMGQLWFCTDILPAEYCKIADMPAGSTYAQVVRTLRPELQGARVMGRRHWEGD
jgi:hypothetical protein